MNKQEVIAGIKDEEILGADTERSEGFNEGLKAALAYVDKLDEPEKPLLSKEEAEWIEKLRERRQSPEEMIITILSSRGGCDFVFKSKNKTYMLPYKNYIGKEKYGSVRKRLVRAALYGYKLKPLYTVEIPNTDSPDSEHLVLCRVRDKIYFDFVCSDDWKTLNWTQLTEEEIKEKYEWAWALAKEVSN